MLDPRLLQLPAGLEPTPALTPFEGGLDTETTGWRVPVGRLRDSLNYEADSAGGYRDVRGYERYDGRPRPSDASFTILDVTITGDIDVGDTVTGAISAATGKVIALGTYPDDPDQDYLVLTKVTGIFDEANENLTVTAVVEGNTDAEGYADSSPTGKLTAQYKNLAADLYRADIAVVPGEDSVWGVFQLGADKYAIRNAVGGATAVLHKATIAGWVAVALGKQIAFTSGGVFVLLEGQTITGATSAATALVQRVQVTSGSFAAGTAAGWLTLSGQVGAFVAENLNVGANLNVATIAGNSTTITLAPDGLLDTDVSNFANPAGAERVYGADGVNPGWEFDGTVFAFIRTGMAVDKPTHVIVHKKQLFFSFVASIQHSAPGQPFVWSVIVGAAEIAIGERITGYQVEPGSEGNGALFVCGRQRNHILYGNDVGDWNLVEYRERIGAHEWTIQALASSIFLDDRGITDLHTSQRFGNFAHSAMSGLIQTLITAKKPLAIGSTVVRNKNQYRLFFSDESAIYVTMNGDKLVGMTPVQLLDQPVTFSSEENQAGTEEVYFGCDDGFVYQMEKGTSFDGEPIYAFLLTHFDNAKRIEINKGYEGPVTVEAKGSGYAEFDMAYYLDYGRSAVAQPDFQVAEVPGLEGLIWDSGLLYDTGLAYDQSTLVPTIGLDLRGEGRNISWIIRKESDYFEPLLLSGVHYRFIPRVNTRG